MKFMFFYYRHISALIFFKCVCSLFLPCMRKYYSVMCGSENIMQYKNVNTFKISDKHQVSSYYLRSCRNNKSKC